MEWILNSRKWAFLSLFLWFSQVCGKISCVDVKQVIQKSLAYTDLMKKIENLQNSYKKELEPTGLDFQKRRDELIKNKPKNPNFDKDMIAYTQELEKFQSKIEASKSHIDQLTQNGQVQIEGKFHQALLEVTSKIGFNDGVLDKNAVVEMGSMEDLTPKTLDRLNAVFPTVDLDKCEKNTKDCDEFRRN